ncbi:ankyrin homolog [Mercenaria mercenaria]|uniref:ankyrin homolog n=1 Tax=Mercenaria mercenaria TaxID=6596 RepID=UPI00234E8A55|nr:ankyrin homolog [Mercenaria mercenaria]XP_045204567.2 ankyrin homolog [Mercenaria mercenaria]XP_053399600.1 ankyrin homolog [Mercenaria mercenaria]
MNPEQQLHLAVKEKDVKKIEQLLNNGVDINCLFYGWTPLQYAVSLGLEEVALLLIDKGSDIHKKHHKADGCPLEGAIKKRLPKVLKVLLDKGIDPNTILSDGNPAIFTAVDKDYTDILKILIDGKADPNLLNKAGESALFISSRDGKSKLVQVLIEGGADMDFKCAEAGNQTSLIIATANEQNSVVKLLLKNRCNINLQDNDEWTALWHAYSNNDEDMMNLLLKSGANKEIPDSDGRTLLQDAQENDDDSVVELLQRFTRSWTN